MALATKNSPEILNSWKEIATYLNRGVRTVQRWERELRLPAHRIGSGKRSPVFALIPELKFWLNTSGVNLQKQEPAEIHLAHGRNGDKKDSPLKLSHELIAKSQELVRTVAATSVRQQLQAEILQKRILEIRSRMR